MRGFLFFAQPAAPTGLPRLRPQVLMIVVVMLSLLLAACQPVTPQSAAAPQVTVIRVGTGDSGDGLSPHQQIIQAYEDQDPTIIVQLEPVAGRDYYARLLTQLSAKAAPDIMQIGDDAVPSFVNKGAFVPLDECIAANAFDTGAYLPGLLEPGQIDGQQYLLPKDYSPLAVYYNKKVFDAAGVAYPSPDWTWDDLLATAPGADRPNPGHLWHPTPGDVDHRL